MNAGAYGSTSGTDERRSRPMMERLMTYSLPDEIARLRGEQEWRQSGRNSMTLAKDVDFRVVLSVLGDGETLHEEDGDARTSLQLLEGRARLAVDAEETELDQADLAAVDAGNRWQLTAVGECAVLLTLAWPREKAGV